MNKVSRVVILVLLSALILTTAALFTFGEGIPDMLKSLSGNGSFTNYFDVNKDGVVNIADVSALLSYLANGCQHKQTATLEGSPATCTEPGYTGTVYCAQCGEILTDPQTIPALGHQFDEDGVCTRCGLHTTTEPTFVVSTAAASAGEKNVSVTIAVQNNPDISSIGLTVNYDPTLTLTDVAYNTDIGGQNMPPQKMQSPIKLVWVSPFANVSGDWTFVTLKFDVSANASGTLPITVTYDENDVYDMTETNIPFAVVNGGITVQ